MENDLNGLLRVFANSYNFDDYPIHNLLPQKWNGMRVISYFQRDGVWGSHSQ
jgi:hypothetical protein